MRINVNAESEKCYKMVVKLFRCGHSNIVERYSSNVN